jgi:subtilisin family serine protease
METINEALAQSTYLERDHIVPSKDTSGHGTAIAGIAAGNGLGNQGQELIGVAPESELLIVKLGNPRKDGFPRTTELMQGVDYVIRKALEYQMPVAINISFGNTYGAHDGTSLLERFLDAMSSQWKNVICIGSGNEGTSAGYTAGFLSEGEEAVIELGIQENEPTLNLQIWKNYVDLMDISLMSPSGMRVGPLAEMLGSQRFVLGNTEILLYYGEPSPFSVKQEIFFDFLPRKNFIDSGVWKIILTPRRVITGEYQMWLPSQGALNVGTAFLKPVGSTTLTVPSTATRVVTVGAYDGLTFGYADFSGRGPSWIYEGINYTKPDLVAPGVRVTSCVPGGGYAQFTGTSFATPFVTGSAALLMEWGIVEGHDAYLYGDKVKSYLRRGATKLSGFEEWPNNQVGWGALCLRNSLPV